MANLLGIPDISRMDHDFDTGDATDRGFHYYVELGEVNRVNSETFRLTKAGSSDVFVKLLHALTLASRRDFTCSNQVALMCCLNALFVYEFTTVIYTANGALPQ